MSGRERAQQKRETAITGFGGNKSYLQSTEEQNLNDDTSPPPRPRELPCETRNTFRILCSSLHEIQKEEEVRSLR